MTTKTFDYSEPFNTRQPMSEIIAQFNAAAWMDAKIHRPARLREAAGKLFWTQGAVQELFSCDVDDIIRTNQRGSHNADSITIRKVISSAERTGKLSVEEELERERTRSRSVGVEAYNVSEDGKTMLYRANGKWFFYDVEHAQSCAILASFTGKGFPTNFSSQKFKTISFTCANNVYIGEMKYNRESRDLEVSLTQVTTIGDESKDISCGAADYIISEEFNRLTGHWVSDKYVLYTVSLTAHLNHITIPKDDTTEVMAYPRVGDANPIVIVAVYDKSAKTHRVLPKDAIVNACKATNGFEPEYFPRFGFADSDTFFVMALDRAQERSALLAFKCTDLVRCDEKDIQTTWSENSTQVSYQTIHTQSIPWAWVEVTDAVKITSKRSILGYHAVETQPEAPYFHLHYAEKTLPSEGSAQTAQWTPLTHGAYNVNPSSVSVVGDSCFFLGGIHDYLGSTIGVVKLGEKDPKTVALTKEDEQVYSFTVLTDKGSSPSAGGDGAPSSPDGTTRPIGVAYVSATKNTAAKLSVIIFDDNFRADGPQPSNEPVLIPTGWGMPLEGNWAANAVVKYDAIVPKLYRPVNRRGVIVPTLVHIPKNRSRASLSGALPVYVYVYGGPHVQLIRAGDEYEYAFSRYFQTLLHQGYAVVIIDNQMSHANDLRHHSICKRNMGRFEVEDFTDALDGVAKKDGLGSLLDLNRVAINGASYGGYASLLAMSQAPERFRLAFAEAPVGDWRLYDTGYTERYMGLLPKDEEAYEKGSIPAYVKGFPDEPLRLFISHGLTDENVHFTNTTRVVDALEAAGKPFYMDVYPGERHGLRQKPTSIPHRRGQVISTMNALL